MATEKRVLPSAVAVARLNVPNAPDAVERREEAAAAAATPAIAGTPTTVRFVKTFGIGDVIKFADGTSFRFRWIKRNNASGYLPNSYVDTSDAKLIANLRAAAAKKLWGIFEVK